MLNKRMYPILDYIADCVANGGRYIVIVPAFRYMFRSETYPFGYRGGDSMDLLVFDDFFDFDGNVTNAKDRFNYLKNYKHATYEDTIVTAHGSKTTKCVFYWRKMDKEDEEKLGEVV